MGTLAVIVFLFVAAAFTGGTWSYFIGGDAGRILLGTTALPAAYLGVILASFRWHRPWLLAAGKITSVAMGFLNFAFLAALLCWPVVALATGLRVPLEPTLVAGGLFGAALLVGAYGWWNAGQLHVTRYTVPLLGLPAGWQGREVAVVSDVHVGAIRGEAFVRRVVALLHALRPTMVLVPGDMFDGAELDVARAVAPWAALQVPHGIFFVTGNHDELRDCAPYVDALRAVGVRVLDNEQVEVDGVVILGIRDPVTHQPERYREIMTQFNLRRDRPSILLAHRPSHLEIPAAAGVSLQVSGHTHAGQFPLFSQLVRSVYGRFGYGLNRHETLQVVTSSGAGTGGPPFRVGTRSEVVMVRLERAEGDS